MTELWAAGQLITVRVDDQGLPIHFVWQEQTYHIEEIVQAWQLDTEWWRTEGRVWRDYVVAMTTDHLLCVIYHDALSEEWRLLRFYD
jgi:hypothetical protein